MIGMYPAAILATVPGNLECGRHVNVVLVFLHVSNSDIPGRGRQLAIPIIIRIIIVVNGIAPCGIRCLPHRSVQQDDLAQVIPDCLARLGILRFAATHYYPRHGLPRVSRCGGFGILQHQEQEPCPGDNRGQD